MTDRTPADYAIEFAGYMAESAERFMHAINVADSAQTIGLATFIDHATEQKSDAWRALESAIYEFRKRRDRAAKEVA